MKKLMTLMLGAALVIGCATPTFAQDTKKETKTKKSKKTKAPKKSSGSKS